MDRYRLLAGALGSAFALMACQSASSVPGGASGTTATGNNPGSSGSDPSTSSGSTGTNPGPGPGTNPGPGPGPGPGPRPTSGPGSDEFEGSGLGSAWTILNSDQFGYTVSGGVLRMTPTKNCVWFHADEGPAIVQPMTGDFKVTAMVRARRASNPSQPPPPEFQFAGIIARDPASANAKENYVFTVMGERGGWLTNETKTTVDDGSDVHGPNEGRKSADAELRLCRVGQVFRLYNRPPAGGSWKLEMTYDRASAPLPATLQVGPIAYTYTNAPDLVGEFDYVRFAQVSGVGDCTTN